MALTADRTASRPRTTWSTRSPAVPRDRACRRADPRPPRRVARGRRPRRPAAGVGRGPARLGDRRLDRRGPDGLLLRPARARPAEARAGARGERPGLEDVGRGAAAVLALFARRRGGHPHHAARHPAGGRRRVAPPALRPVRAGGDRPRGALVRRAGARARVRAADRGRRLPLARGRGLLAGGRSIRAPDRGRGGRSGLAALGRGTRHVVDGGWLGRPGLAVASTGSRVVVLVT